MFKSSKQGVLTVFALVIMFGVISCVAAEPNTASSQPDAFAINKLIGRGVNLGNALEAPKEGDWGVTLEEGYFQLIKDAGFNSIRLPVRWSIHAANEPPYTIDPNFFNRVDWAIKNALSRNLVLVFNMHNYYELLSDPNNNRERFLALWKQIAEHYKDYPNMLLFEILNEPADKLDPMWNTLVKDILAVVRQTNPNRTIVIGPNNFNEVFRLKNLELPKDDLNIIVTFHYYNPNRFTHQGAPWVKDSNGWLGMKWTGSEQEKRAIGRDFNVAVGWGKANNRPIFLGEFGTFYKADMESRVRWAKCVADTAAEDGFSMCYWQFASNFAIYDTENKTWIKPLLEAIIPPKQ
jgi:endoglucanase